MNNKTIVAGLALGMFAGSPSWADDFYCGTHIISEGLSKGDVVQHCGKPLEEDGDTWVYDRGPEKLAVQLHFDGEGLLERITDLTYRGD